MSNSERITKLIFDVSSMFLGNYESSNEYVDDIKKEMMDISTIPNCSEDKASLRNDFNTILKDTQKAKKEIKEELING